MCGSGSPQSKRWRKGNPAEAATGALGVNDESGDCKTTMTRTVMAEQLEERERLAKKTRTSGSDVGGSGGDDDNDDAETRTGHEMRRWEKERNLLLQG